MKKLRIGIIGCGGVANGHIRGVLDSRDLEISALCDIVPERLAEKVSAYGIAGDLCYDNHISLMESGKVDAVSICTPNNAHFHIAMDAIKRGIPYAVEKPAGMNEAEVAQMLAATEGKSLANMVCFSYRFVSAARFMRDIVKSGELGRLFHIGGDYLQAGGIPGTRDGESAPLVWRFVKGIAASGALGDLGCHMIDLMRFITGREFTYVNADMDTFINRRRLLDGDGYGVVDVDDYISVTGQMEDQLASNMFISRYAYGRGNYQRVEIYGEKGALRYYLDGKGSLEINIGSKAMREGHVWAEIPVPPKYDSAQMQSFADVVNGCGDGLAASIHDGLAVQRVLDAALLAAESGNRVRL